MQLSQSCSVKLLSVSPLFQNEFSASSRNVMNCVKRNGSYIFFQIKKLLCRNISALDATNYCHGVRGGGGVDIGGSS